MAHSTIEEFLDEIYREVSTRSYFKSISVKIEGPILKCRVRLNNSFIDIFFNEDTKTTAFTLIKNHQRIFGIDKDSLRGWHKHPAENPESHLPCSETTFKEFINHVESIKNL